MPPDLTTAGTGAERPDWLAGGPGFEPRLRSPGRSVLPLSYPDRSRDAACGNLEQAPSICGILMLSIALIWTGLALRTERQCWGWARARILPRRRFAPLRGFGGDGGWRRRLPNGGSDEAQRYSTGRSVRCRATRRSRHRAAAKAAGRCGSEVCRQAVARGFGRRGAGAWGAAGVVAR